MALAYTETPSGGTATSSCGARDDVVAFLTRKWEREMEFSADGLMRRREASIDDVQIEAADRWIRGPREDGDTTPLPLR